MKQIVRAFVAFFITLQSLSAQDVTYVLFNRDCMNQLEYRYSYPNVKGDNAVWAYSIKPNMLEHYVFMTEGAGHYSPELPEGAITCRNLDLDDAYVAAVNRETQQMIIVFQRQSGGYWLMPVASATLVARNGSRYWVRASQSSFQFDTLRLVNEQNLAVTGSPTAAYFSGAKLNNCLMEYSFHCEPVKSGQIRSDFQFIPGIGVVNDRTGNSASQAMENELQLVKVNGMTLDDYIRTACPDGPGKIKMSKYQKPANYGDENFEADKEMTSIMQKEQSGEAPAEYDVSGIQCAEDWEPGTHIVQKGENLRAIARTYKISEQNIVKWNKIQNPDRIEVCQKLWLKQPPANASSTRKGAVKAQTYDAQPATAGKTVKTQGTQQAQKGIQKTVTEKSYDPNRPITHSDESKDANDYEYFQSEETKGVRIHTVHRGEYLYKIAKMYGCPEECIRIANGFSLEGDEPLSIGQELIIPECTCTVNGKVIKSSAAATGGSAVKKQQPTVKKQTPATTEKQPYDQRKKPRASILDTDEGPAMYGNEEEPRKDESQPASKTNRFEEEPLYDDEASRTNTNPKSKTKPKKGENKVQLFKEHHVKQGETLNSIAAKYKVSASELSQVNGLNPKEALVPGKLVLIPIDAEEE
ncbi:MAG: LysM peptidoglycan-binding domain-containing protein [Saprospiraceae bacterium]|nr:LysM peptidoglycan-binding domain-containing protein [Saprospiraceae bacterium]